MEAPTKPGIYLRGGIKSSFDEPENVIGYREIVVATDTGEIGTTAGWFDISIPLSNSGKIGEIFYENDETIRTFGTTWADGKIWTSRPFTGGSRIKVEWRCPFRNDSTSWGGGYIDIQYAFNEGAYISLGHSGYDGGVMNNGASGIGSMSGNFALLNCPAENFTLQMKFMHKSYDGTVTINGSHDISTGENGIFWTNILYTEILG